MVTLLVFWSLSLLYTKVIESCVVDLSDLDAMKALSDEVFAVGGGGGKCHFDEQCRNPVRCRSSDGHEHR